MEYILGISYSYHDSSAVLLGNNNILAAAEEERFTRIKHDNSFPVNAISYAINDSKITLNDIKLVVIYEDPLDKLLRQFNSSLEGAIKSEFNNIRKLTSNLIENDYSTKDVAKRFAKHGFIKKQDIDKLAAKVIFSKHHLSHAASAYFPSPYRNCAVLCIDGVGETSTTTAWAADNGDLKLLWETKFPHSIGLLYSAFTYYCGFKVNSGEYKLMGLAPYGKPNYANLIKNNIIRIKPNGQFKLNMKYFSYAYKKTMINQNFCKLFGAPPRLSEGNIDQFYMDIAASIQHVCEEVVEVMARAVRKASGHENLVMAGGVALNCVSNGKLKAKGVFKNIWIQPASGDSGTALGAAFVGRHLYLKRPITFTGQDRMQGSRLGPAYSDEEISASLKSYGCIFDNYEEDKLLDIATDLIDRGMVIGWFNGRMEFGPRALGGRSILGDPRNPVMQKVMNLKIKFRESFRPFAPSALLGHIDEYFQDASESPYMLFTTTVQKSQEQKEGEYLPAITHVDGSARLQTVDPIRSRMYYKLIKLFYEKTGCPVIINTSFNVRGEPIVCSPVDAFECFMRTNMDALVIGNFIVVKELN